VARVHGTSHLEGLGTLGQRKGAEQGQCRVGTEGESSGGHLERVVATYPINGRVFPSCPVRNEQSFAITTIFRCQSQCELLSAVSRTARTDSRAVLGAGVRPIAPGAPHALILLV
jgi:hypothetical protein